MKHQSNISLRALVLFVVVSLLFAGCGSGKSAQNLELTATPTLTVTPSLEPSPTPTSMMLEFVRANATVQTQINDLENQVKILEDTGVRFSEEGWKNFLDHEEKQTDAVVAVAISGDVAQTLVGVSDNMESGIALLLLIVCGGGFIILVFSKGKNGGGTTS